MAVCEFHPEKGSEYGVKCIKSKSIKDMVAMAPGMMPGDIEEIVCLGGTDDNRSADCKGFQDLRSLGEKSKYAATPPVAFPEAHR